jgi:hypothetical protein
MQYIYIPEFQALRGEEAIKALNDYIRELEEQKPVELTDTQVNALIKFAQGLISFIETDAPPASNKKIGFKEQFKKMVMKCRPVRSAKANV